jgi:hypothetical protein
MSRLLKAPDIPYAREALLNAAGDHRATLGAALWVELPGVLDAVRANPRHIRRVPANWVGHVVACLDADEARAAAAADPRQCTQHALDRWHRTRRTSDAPVSVDVDDEDNAGRKFLDDVRSYGGGTPVDAATWRRAADYLAGVTLRDDALAAAVVAMWSASPDGGGRDVLCGRAPAWLAADILVGRRRWGRDDCALALATAEATRTTANGTDELWRVVTAGAPDLDDGAEEAWDSERPGGRTYERSTFMLALLRTASGTAPDFAVLSHRLWGEHTAAVLVWAAQRGEPTRTVALDAHHAFATAPGQAPERAGDPGKVKWALQTVAGDREVRQAIALHCRAGSGGGTAVWAEEADDSELDEWVRRRAAAGIPVDAGDIGSLVKSELPRSAAYGRHLARRQRGFLAATLNHPTGGSAAVAIDLLGEAFGDDADKWRTALELADDGNTVDEIVAAVAAVHG